MLCYEGNENYIFVSYAHKDSTQVIPIVKALHDADFRIWYDAGIEAGSEWPENVAEHLCGSQVVLIFLSQNALNSQNCIREIHFAISENKDILVIYLEELKLTAGMRMQLGPLQAMFFNRYANAEDFLQTLLSAKILQCCKQTDGESVPTKKATAQKAPTKAVSAPPKKGKEVCPPTVTPTQIRCVNPYMGTPLKLFDCSEGDYTIPREETEATTNVILSTFKEFNFPEVKITSVNSGPTVTRYNVNGPGNVSPRKLTSLEEKLALYLASNGVRLYPNYKDGAISIEVPNKKRGLVALGSMLAGLSDVQEKPNAVTIPLGKDAVGSKVYADLNKMAHVLIGGISASGKSIFLNSLILSLVYKYSPEDLRLILIDPKRVEFISYQGLPHLMFNEAVTAIKKMVESLRWAIDEMERRYRLFEEMSGAGTYAINIDEYNRHVEKSQKLPRIVIIIDELADLMLVSKKEVERYVQSLTQKARAAGIHLIAATQRPNADVITGALKANFPARIAFFVPTAADSRVILDQPGAQKLLGRGDFLYTMPGISEPIRVQSPFVSNEDVYRAVEFIKNSNHFETE